MRKDRSNPVLSSEKTLTGRNFGQISTTSFYSVQTTPRKSPNMRVTDPERANYKTYKAMANTQLLLDKYQQLKRSDLK